MEWQPGDTVEIPLTLGQVAFVDRRDLSLIAGSSWHAQPRRDGMGFYAVNADGVRMHRLLMDVWDDSIVDHRDGDGLNNRRLNLRNGTQSQNCVNRRRTPGPYPRGVRPKKAKWQAYIKFQGKQKSLGYFDTPDEAHQAYMAAATRLHGDWMPLPLPPQKDKGE